MPIPDINGNPLMPSPYFSANYVGSARMDLGAADWGAPGTPKVYRAVELWADNLASAAQWCNVYYTIDEGTRTKLGTSAKSPKDVLYFPDETLLSTTNLITNPSLETASTDYAAYNGATVLRVATTAPAGDYGSYSMRVDTPGAAPAEGVAYAVADKLAASTKYTVSVYVRGAGTAQVRYRDITNGQTIIGDSVTLSGTAWSRLSVTFTTHADLTSDDNALVIVCTSGTEAVRFYCDGWQIETGATVTSYCDGTQRGCYWTGTPHASSSVRVGGFTTGQSIALSLESFTASAGITPIYRSIVLRGALRPKSIDQISAVVRIADNMRDRQEAAMRSGATMLAELRGMAQSNSPQLLEDLTGAVQYVSVLAPVSEQETYQAGEDNPEIAATVKMSVLSYS
jgi:hypothetical protein